MNWKTLPVVVFMTGMTLLGVMMVLLAWTPVREVSEDATALYRGGAPAKCLTTPNQNCPAATKTCAATSCTQGTFRYYCPAGGVDEIQANNAYQYCNPNQPAGFAICNTNAQSNNGTMTCVNNRLCDQSRCTWDTNNNDWRCVTDLNNPINSSQEYYIPFTQGTCP
jgi:hypothetical protein